MPNQIRGLLTSRVRTDASAKNVPALGYRRIPLAGALALSALAAACAAGACGGSPPNEAVASSHSALTPNQEPNPTTYTITLSTVDVVLAQELDLPGDPNTHASAFWTPDTGYFDWAELAYNVNGGNATSTACTLGPAPTGAVLGNCVGGGMQNGAFTPGSPLGLTFQTTLPTDTVNVALIMDNLEVFSQAQKNNPYVSLSVGLSVAGNAVATLGAAVGALNAWAGAVIASIGATLSIAGNALSNLPPPTGASPLTCAGGLLGLDPTGVTPVDTMYLSFTGDELAQLTDTATGTNTLTLNPSIGYGIWGGGCASNLEITLTIARNWNTGVGPSPKSADLAVARTTTENDAFWANAAFESIDRIFNPGTGLQDIHVGSMLSVASTPPVAALSANPNDLQIFWADGTGTIQGANGTGPSPTVSALVWPALPYSPPPYANLTAAERSPSNYDVAWIASDGAVWDSSSARAPVQVTNTNEAPPGAPIAMVGRTAVDLDLFFVGGDGQLRTSYSRDSGQTWSTLVIQGAAAAPPGAYITAASPVSQALDVFYVGTSRALYQASWTPIAGWTTVAISGANVARAGAPVSVVSRSPKNLDVAFIAENSVVWASSVDSSSAWTDGGTLPWKLTTLPNVTLAGLSISIVAGTYNNLDVFFQNVFGQEYTGHWNENNDTWTMSALTVPPAPYTATSTNDRYWHDSGGNVYHQDSSGNVNAVLTRESASGKNTGYGASSSLAAFAYPDGGQSVWFLDTLSPPNLRQIYVSPSGGIVDSDWGAAPPGCTWTGKPAVSSWGENRADIYQNANCSGTLHLYHQAWQLESYGWTDITPPQTINSAPAVTSQEVGSLDVIFLNVNDAIVHGSCVGECVGSAGFVWDPPSALMRENETQIWMGDVALASPSPGVLYAFDVDSRGQIDFSQLSPSSPTWTASATWYAPPNGCNQEPGGPAVVRTAPNDFFVACTSTGGVASAGWGDTSLQGTWWYLGSGVVGVPAVTAH
jgi:hypothetical protein